MKFLHAAAGIAACLFFLGVAARADGTNPPAPQGAALLKTDILAVFAHPDDETGVASTIADCALVQHRSVAAAYCTRGEGGGNAVGTQAGKALGILRESELHLALEALGVRSTYFLDAEDFGYTEDLRITLDRWDHLERLGRLVRLVRALRPEVLLAQDPAPRPGQHGHHQAAGILALEAFDVAADPTRFPDQMDKEGLMPWRPRKLYWPGPKGTGATLEIPAKLADGRLFSEIIAAAVSSHRSQGFGRFSADSWQPEPQSWTLVKSAVPWAFDETELSRGLPVQDSVPARLLAPGDTAGADRIRVRFRGRPGVEAYVMACREQQIQHATTLLTTDIPVVAGELSELNLWSENLDPQGVNARIRLTVPEGWAVPAETWLRFSPLRTNLHRLMITPPQILGDADITATVLLPDGERRISARLHPVPRLSVARVAAPLKVDAPADDPGWQALAPHEISHTNVWEGTVRDAADSSATFRLAHDDDRLYFEVRVRDDVVVSNLAPQDLRGHWRSDSIELCIDPAAGAAHTLGSFKLGIVPFDFTGKVGAVRDADAHPGPISEAAPSCRLFSWRTDDGYAIRGLFLLNEAGIRPDGNRRFGFNLLVYDGDKAGAEAGENINKSRIAWSPRPGVSGRPEDWGKADLE